MDPDDQWADRRIESTGIPLAKALEAAALLVEWAESSLVLRPESLKMDLIHLPTVAPVTPR